MVGVKRMPRPLSESRKPESRRKIAVLRGMRLRQIDSPLGFPGQPCARGGGLGWGQKGRSRIAWLDARLRGPGSAVERGGEAYERGDYAAALKEWSAAAGTGDPEASYRLGLLYARGHGVLANLADAAVWYRRAAEQGHAMAQHQLSLLHLDGYRAHASNFARWYGAAAKRDPEAADHNRALLFPNGFDVPQDPAGALRWSRAAAEQGIADA